MGFAFYWARNDGIGGHVWLSEDDLRALTDEMLVQGMPWPAGAVSPGSAIGVHELEAILEPAVVEPQLLADAKLWRDWLVFLEGAAHNGGLLIKP